MPEHLRNEIITKAVYRAISNGWRPKALPPDVRRLHVECREKKIWIGEENGVGMGWKEEFLLTSASFAKCFWGKDWMIHNKEIMYAKDIAEYLKRGL